MVVEPRRLCMHLGVSTLGLGVVHVKGDSSRSQSAGTKYSGHETDCCADHDFSFPFLQQSCLSGVSSSAARYLGRPNSEAFPSPMFFFPFSPLPSQAFGASTFPSFPVGAVESLRWRERVAWLCPAFPEYPCRVCRWWNTIGRCLLSFSSFDATWSQSSSGAANGLAISSLPSTGVITTSSVPRATTRPSGRVESFPSSSAFLFWAKGESQKR